MKVGTFHHWN